MCYNKSRVLALEKEVGRMFEYLKKMWNELRDWLCLKVPGCYARRHQYDDTD